MEIEKNIRNNDYYMRLLSVCCERGVIYVGEIYVGENN
jgi:hypothetical protein